MRDLNYQLKQLCRRNRDGSFATQRDRERVLDLVANQLQEAGFRHLSATSLKPKHVDGLVARWQVEGLAAYFSPSWTAFQADRGRDFSVIVDGVSN